MTDNVRKSTQRLPTQPSILGIKSSCVENPGTGTQPMIQGYRHSLDFSNINQNNPVALRFVSQRETLNYEYLYTKLSNTIIESYLTSIPLVLPVENPYSCLLLLCLMNMCSFHLGLLSTIKRQKYSLRR